MAGSYNDLPLASFFFDFFSFFSFSFFSPFPENKLQHLSNIHNNASGDNTKTCTLKISFYETLDQNISFKSLRQRQVINRAIKRYWDLKTILFKIKKSKDTEKITELKKIKSYVHLQTT